jgi:hypothetical protein
VEEEGEAEATGEEPSSESAESSEAAPIEADADDGLAMLDDPDVAGEPELPDESAPELPPVAFDEPPILEVPELDPQDETIGGEVLTADDSLPTDIESLALSPEAVIGLPAFTEHLNDTAVLLPEEVEDPYFSWGLWIKSGASETAYAAADVTGAWASGDMTPAEVIDANIRNAQTATYTGGVAGIVHDNTAGTAAMMQNGAVSLTFNFGQSSVSGNMQFDAGSDHWNMAVGNSAVDNSGFSIGSFTSGAGSTVTVGEGSATGHFYGPGAQAVGGTFDVDSADAAKTAIGAFTGRK